ncbi:hypothetical protein [Streptomyces sp. NBC_01264]|uniref:hypothetical protein n=1 Tax=Streptomyces sp. NBC_01264 TaxID=2903804 RepID=UPI002256BF0D|nr:hypothetical protein [Streptomyces sp. NBC_01264]MCX4777984.1 hypothetical protein [Streptomyces sp. NBC_01264]
MGGHARDEQGRRRRPLLRRAVLLMAFGVLAGTAFLCRTAGAGAGAGDPAAAGPGARARHAAHAPGAHRAVCAAPYDRPGCSPLSHVQPGLLPPAPPAVLMAGGAPTAPAVLPGPAQGIRPPAALARGPDLYALQVLRT